jgi:hypothetical protein
MSEWPLGFIAESVPPGKTVEIISRPNIDFQPARLLIPSTHAFAFRVVNLLSDGKSVMREPVAATEVDENALRHGHARRVCEGLPVCKKGQPMTLIVENISAKAQRLAAAVLGHRVTVTDDGRA